MRLSLSDKYVEVHNLATQGPKIQSRRHRGFCGLSSQTKPQHPNWNVKH